MAATFKASDITFSDQYVRKLADQMAQLYYFAKAAEQVWAAQSLSADFPSDATVVPDSASSSPLSGSGNDGRPVITGIMVQILMSNVQTFINTMEANTNLILNQTIQVAVNPQR